MERVFRMNREKKENLIKRMKKELKGGYRVRMFFNYALKIISVILMIGAVMSSVIFGSIDALIVFGVVAILVDATGL